MGGRVVIPFADEQSLGPVPLALLLPCRLLLPLWHDIPLDSGVTSSREPPRTSPPTSLCFLQVVYFYL